MHIRYNESNQNMRLFTDMLGQHYDIIWTYVSNIQRLYKHEENPKLVKVLIKRYLNDTIDREDLDMYVAQYLDELDESGEMNDIVYESTLE